MLAVFDEEKVAADVAQTRAALAEAEANLAEARQALRGLDFDFALLDVNLPDGRSLELLEDKSVPASVASASSHSHGSSTKARSAASS